MKSITSFPTEILLQIFKDDGLTPTDLARCAQTCRKIRDITDLADFKIDYVFKVDHTSHAGWRLIRCILLNPQTGERIKSLKLEWFRRQRLDKTTWTLKWSWTDDELSQISKICEKHKLDKAVYTAIKHGLNSEALLPLLLCFTTNLEALDVGDVGHDMISDQYGHTIFDANRIYTHCMGPDYQPPETHSFTASPPVVSDMEAEIKEWFESGAAPYEHNGRVIEPITSTPFIYSTFTPKAWPPGLSNIKEFAHGGSNCGSLEFRPQHLNTWPNTNISTMLQLPKLETLKLTHINALMGTPISNSPKPKHKLKRLEIYHYRFYKHDFITVVGLTGGHLESVVCLLSDENFSIWDMPPSQKLGLITDYFQQGSKDTLARDKIAVTRSFRPFFDSFSFDRDEHEALFRDTEAITNSKVDWFYGLSEGEEWGPNELPADTYDGEEEPRNEQ
ncbi:hypothetical protein TWF481_011263 [Arthrobotrys musiformis]|uniref:F-box domain-containing protein n=1 Tax=Arthrobotrys musiformis TaxID=47236 RepID=A0AAV9VZN1_9PEZI